MIIREAVQTDNHALIDLQKRCPMGSELLLQLDSSPDYFNRSRGYKDWHLLVAEDEGKIVGSAGYAIQEKTIEDKRLSFVYEYGFMVDPGQRRKGIASMLQEEVEARTLDVDFMHLNITEENHASHSFFTGLGFRTVKHCAPYMIMAYKEHQTDKYQVRKMKEGDIPIVVELLNETYHDYSFYEPFTVKSFKEHYERLPHFSLEDIYLYEQDTVEAVAGTWDYDQVMKFTLLEFNIRWRMMRLMTKLMGLFIAMPNMPGKGDSMSNWYLTPIGYRDPYAAKQLLGFLLNKAVKNNVGMISLPLDKDSHIMEILTDFQVSKGSFLWYIKPRKGNDLPDEFNNPLYVDVKDV